MIHLVNFIFTLIYLKFLEYTGKWHELNIFSYTSINLLHHNFEICIIYKIMFENTGQCQLIDLSDNAKEMIACMSEF
jgi:hypothetical protein